MDSEFVDRWGERFTLKFVMCVSSEDVEEREAEEARVGMQSDGAAEGVEFHLRTEPRGAAVAKYCGGVGEW